MSDNQEEKIKRFFEVVKHFKLTQKEIALKTGLSQPKISEIKNGKAGSSILNNIFYRLHYEFGVNKEWWDSGKGEMTSNSVLPEIKPENTDDVIYNEGYWKGRYDELLNQYEEVKNELNALKSTSAS